jgi:hypothetical protein
MQKDEASQKQSNSNDTGKVLIYQRLNCSLQYYSNMATPTPTLSPVAPPQWALQWSEIVVGLGSVVLTILLVVLYKRQQEQLAAQHEAVLERLALIGKVTGRQSISPTSEMGLRSDYNLLLSSK